MVENKSTRFVRLPPAQSLYFYFPSFFQHNRATSGFVSLVAAVSCVIHCLTGGRIPTRCFIAAVVVIVHESLLPFGGRIPILVELLYLLIVVVVLICRYHAC